MFAWKQAPYVKLILETASCLWKLHIFKCLKHISFSGGREEFITFWAYAFDLVTSSFKSWSVMNKLKNNNGLSAAATSIFIPLFSLNWNTFKTGLALDQLSFELPLFSSPSLDLSSARLLYYLLHQNLDLLDSIICTRWVITWKVTIIWCNRALIYWVFLLCIRTVRFTRGFIIRVIAFALATTCSNSSL